MFRGARGFVCALLLVTLQSSLSFGTAAISGNLQDAGGAAISGRVFVRFWLRGCNNNQPRVAGVALIAPTGGPGYYKDFTPDAAGAISGALYKNSEVECNGATGNTWWGVQVYRDGKPGPETPYSVVAATFSLNTASPLVQSPPPPPATFPYIMANPLAAQTISNFPLAFGAGSGLSANYQGSVRAAGTYLRSDGSSFFAPVSSSQLASDIVSAPSLNGLAYWNGSALSTTPTGGAGTLCLVSTSGAAPLFSSCAGSASTAWSALSAPSANLTLNMGSRTTAFSWVTGTGANALFTLDGTAGNGSGPTLLVKGQPHPSEIFQVQNSVGSVWLGASTTQGLYFGIVPRTSGISGFGTGPLFITQPAGSGVGNGDVQISGGTGPSSGQGGSVSVDGGWGTATNAGGGHVFVAGGVGNGTGFGGTLTLIGGQGGSNAGGGDVSITAGIAGGGNNNGGKISLRAGLKAGSGAAGYVEFVDPTDPNKQARILPSALPIFSPLATVGIAFLNTASVDFPSVAANACSALSITVTGAADGDAVSLGVPNGLASTIGLTFSGYVSAANTITVRACNVTTGASADPAAASVRAVVWKF